MVFIILGKGFEELEALSPCDILRRGGVSVAFAAVGTEKAVAGSHGITVSAELLTTEISPSADDTFVIPGGMGGVNSIKADSKTMKLIKTAADIGAGLAAICAGPSVLAELGITDGKHITCYPGCEKMMRAAICDSSKAVVSDGSLITGRSVGSAIDFSLALLSQIKGKNISDKVRTELVY